jgi:hypothetical protein
MKYGGGFLIFGILILTVEDDPLQFLSKPTKFSFALGVFDSLQAKMQGFLGSIGNGAVARLTLCRLGRLLRAFVAPGGTKPGNSCGRSLRAAFTS